MARHRRLLISGALASLALAGVAVVSLPPTPVRSGGVARNVRVEASAYAFTPAMIKVNPGDRVTIELASADTVHGLHIEGYDINLTADPGQPASVSFVADRPGTFRIHCSVPCGPLHAFMAGRLRVGPPLNFWRAVALAVLAVAVGGLAVWRKPTPPSAGFVPS
ncbi:MAG: cupredoxin domain-containing protein [Anaerolineales bacterium]|nr:cupredoxin domain-containing protein [Anaerolineales bacterium]